MEELISKIKGRLSSGQFQSETAVREAIVLPVLQTLGWDIFDPDSVIRELSLGPRRVDYALSSNIPRKEIFIEVKAVGHVSGSDRQLFEYAFHEGIPFAVLTDGREWNFFVPGEQGSYDERLVQKLDIVERSVPDSVRIFRRYLEYAEVKTGKAIENARADYRNISKQKIASQAIPTAWRDLVLEPDELLIDLITEKAESLCGFRPAPEDVEEFLIKALQSSSASTTISRPESSEKPDRTRTTAATPVSERKISYEILGNKRSASNAMEALIDILRTLAERDPQFVEKLSRAVPGRTRNHIARSRDDVYPKKPELIEYTTKLVPGWWIGTNIANRDKLRIIEKAAQIQNLRMGADLKIALPNT